MIAVFSDIHGDSHALRALLQDINSHNPEKIIFLGDAVTGPDPKGTIDILSTSGCIPIAGNVEWWIIQGDIYVEPDHRRSNIAALMADEIAKIAKTQGYSKMLGSVCPQAQGATNSMKVLLAYGFKLAFCTENMIYFQKEI